MPTPIAPPLLAKPSTEYIKKFQAGQVKSPTFVSADLALEVDPLDEKQVAAAKTFIDAATAELRAAHAAELQRVENDTRRAIALAEEKTKEAERALAASEATVADLRKKLAKSQEARAPAASPGGGGGGGGGGGSKKKKGGKK